MKSAAQFPFPPTDDKIKYCPQNYFLTNTFFSCPYMIIRKRN